ncbi:MAG: long-chain fatty acid--CoA ligase [Actinobacteria bacterium]|nr:long-chain fatty acid--CoA ligase [Actinomycetota bacterium]
MGYRSLADVFKSRVKEYGTKTQVRYHRGGKWNELNWIEFDEKATKVSLGMIALGIKPQERIAVFSGNNVEWLLINIGCQCARITDVPLYETLTAQQAEHILKNSGSRIVFAGTSDQLDRVLQIKDRLPDLVKIITIDNTISDHPDVLTFDELMKKGQEYGDRDEYDRRFQSIDEQDLLTVIYTSGTTGEPKGVMLTNFSILCMVEIVSRMGDVDINDDYLSFLPLSHAYERLMFYQSIYKAVPFNQARSIEKLADDINDIKPCFMASVPRLFEKIYAGIMTNMESESRIRRAIFNWSIKVGRKASTYKLEEKPVPAFLNLKYKIADKLVFSKIYDRLGGRFKFFVSAGAPLAREIGEFFAAAGIMIFDTYGLTETSGGLTGCKYGQVKFGSVGVPYEKCEIKIAGDGEILAKAPYIMKGYLNDPGATAAVWDSDGWFHTGDIGYLDEDGFLFINDRKRDLIITSGGKNVAPQNIENALKLESLIEQVCVVGDKRKFIGALIVPNFAELENWAKERGLPTGDRSGLLCRREVLALYEKIIDQALTDFAGYERIKKFKLLPREMTQEAGLITPTLKVKRHEVEAQFAHEIDEIYSDE